MSKPAHEIIIHEGRASVRCYLFGHKPFYQSDKVYKQFDEERRKIIGFYKLKQCPRCKIILGDLQPIPKGRV